MKEDPTLTKSAVYFAILPAPGARAGNPLLCELLGCCMAILFMVKNRSFVYPLSLSIFPEFDWANVYTVVVRACVCVCSWIFQPMSLQMPGKCSITELPDAQPSYSRSIVTCVSTSNLAQKAPPRSTNFILHTVLGGVCRKHPAHSTDEDLKAPDSQGHVAVRQTRSLGCRFAGKCNSKLNSQDVSEEFLFQLKQCCFLLPNLFFFF